ncbi:signal peptide peptidase SppA [bacterium]|nr:MAG: signal peptide peptidase SppA [bacterium]
MKKVLIVLAILLVLAFILIAVLTKIQADFMGGGKVRIKKASVLVVDLSKPFPERGGYDFSGFRFKRKASFLSLIRAIEKAKDDEDIIAISLKPCGMSFNFAQMQEFLEALDKFKASGKPVYAYVTSAGMGTYLTAAAADSIFLTPSGDLMFLGMSVSPMFFAGSAEKLGIGFDVIQIGKYKGAAEMFTEKSLTEPLRESLSALLDGLYSEWLNDVAERRGFSEEQINNFIEYGVFNADEALDYRLVDGLEYPQDYRKRILGLVDDNKDRLVGVKEYAESRNITRGSKKIAVIYGIGSIHTGESEPNPFGGQESIGSKTFSKVIDDAVEDDDIAAIVLRVDSPGGSALASDIIWKSVVDARKKKPVLVSMGGTAASGGYYISFGADSIFCDPTTITGSIGVVFLKPYMSGLFEKIGISVDSINRGPLADEFAMYKSMDTEGYEAFTRLIERIYDDFTSKAAEGRHLELDSLLTLAEGRIWVGSDAVKIGLADRTAGLSETIDIAAKMAELDPEDVGIVTYPREKSFFEFAFELTAPGVTQLIPEPIRETLYPVLEASEIYSSGEPLTLLPVRVDFPR